MRKRIGIFVLFTVLNFAAFGVLFALEGQFEALTGEPVFDTQNDLTSQAVVEQLPLYQGEALAAYHRFAAFDFIFPLVAALFLVSLCSLLLEVNRSPLARRLSAWRVPFFPLTATLFDYLENVSFLSVIQGSDGAINAALIFKQLKLLSISLSGALVLGLLIFTVISWVSSRTMLAKQS